MSKMIIDTAKTVRQVVLYQAQAIPEELFDIQADSYNNTIRWNIGHMIYWMDTYMTLGFSKESAIPASYASFFNSGTAPANWADTPPSKEELIQQLSSQLNSLSELAPESLEVPLEAPLQFGPLTFNRAGELLNFGLVHEGMHLATCDCLRKVIQGKLYR
ncbi:DinB family protein [Paenibacillus alginolyticus]|uniref:DinB family protein n=1 Tax=Paenibacillus alginolyticus TaxID=59839 RepID=A0ABT4GJZ3_9BACL|nr:DinB family protein [Paenibacillus alginolyticus]MCY9696505.1 DinB family protein [Paenibacillus alginolyticus]MEC0147463.1 DinB family protein [Paenibacillus alginolyticus]